MDMITEKNEDEFDAAFKSIMHRTDILSKLVQGLIPEMEGKDLDYVKRCLSPDGMERIPGRDTELRNDRMGLVKADCIFDIIFPQDEGRVGLILGVEGQGKSNPGYPITNRAMVYSSYLLSDQKDKDFKGSDYEKVKKVYAVWIMLHPKTEYRNRILRYRMKGACEWPPEPDFTVPDMDLTEIIFVNLGKPDSELSNDMLGMLNTIFTQGLNRQEREMRLRVNYKISIDDELSDELERINMSMGSELREAIMEDMREEAYEKLYEEAREKAYEEAREQIYEEAYEKAYEEAREQIRREGREKTVQFMIKLLCNTNSSDESVESILKDVDPDIAEEVKRRLQQNKDESN